MRAPSLTAVLKLRFN